MDIENRATSAVIHVLRSLRNWPGEVTEPVVEDLWHRVRGWLELPYVGEEEVKIMTATALEALSIGSSWPSDIRDPDLAGRAAARLAERIRLECLGLDAVSDDLTLAKWYAAVVERLYTSRRGRAWPAPRVDPLLIEDTWKAIRPGRLWSEEALKGRGLSALQKAPNQLEVWGASTAPDVALVVARLAERAALERDLPPPSSNGDRAIHHLAIASWPTWMLARRGDLDSRDVGSLADATQMELNTEPVWIRSAAGVRADVARFLEDPLGLEALRESRPPRAFDLDLLWRVLRRWLDCSRHSASS